MKIDLHCHSKWSKRPTLWIMQKLGCPESFTEPKHLYEIARQRGMDCVTITDHNVIDGALEIAHLPNTFIGCEYTTYFPEDNCKIHLLVYGQTEKQHDDISGARENVFDLVKYLHDNKLRHICAHPLFWVNDRLTLDHVEQLVLLFKNWELNGDMTNEMNDAIHRFVTSLTPGIVERLSNKHGFEPPVERMWEKNLTCGSDDHGSLHLASAYTEVREAHSLDSFFDGVEQGHARCYYGGSSPQRFARNVYGTAYQFYKSKFDLEYYAQKDVFLRFLDQSLQTQLQHSAFKPVWYQRFRSRRATPWETAGKDVSLVQMARYEAERYILDDPKLQRVVREGSRGETDMDRQWFEFVNVVSNKVLTQFGGYALKRILNGRIVDLFHLFGSAGALYALLGPYFVGYGLFRRERLWSEEVLSHFGMTPPETLRVSGAPHIAHFTDTFNEVNGVAKTIQEHLELSQQCGRDYTVLSCFADPMPPQRGVQQFSPVGSLTLPEYPEIKLLTPPFLQMLDHCFKERYTHLHIATPGPVGLAGLGIARILRIPVSGTYHTSIPQYGKILTEDAYVEDILWKFIIWFYNQLDTVFAPSNAVKEELVERGIHGDKIKVYPRGCDIERFNPANRNGILQKEFGVTNETVNFLYVGRLSKEKNLEVLAAAYKSLRAEGLNVRLVVVGDGPYMNEMQAALEGTGAVFAGYQIGKALESLYASADCLVFPSTTDTFGKVVLEAQASGIPVIVSDLGGPQENLVHEETGLVVEGRSVAALVRAMRVLAADDAKRKKFGAAAREYMASRDSKSCFERLYDMYTEDDSTHAAESGERSPDSPFTPSITGSFGIL